MNKEKVLNILGLAQRAGRLLSGDFVVERSMKRQAYPLLIWRKIVRRIMLKNICT